MIDIKEESTEVVSEQGSKGQRGEVGTASASQMVKQLWHAAQEKSPKLSLKRFARQLIKDGDQTAKNWFDNKRGTNNAKRSEVNIKAQKEASMATKLSKKGKKS